MISYDNPTFPPDVKNEATQANIGWKTDMLVTTCDVLVTMCD